jgi:hypothetical protein
MAMAMVSTNHKIIKIGNITKLRINMMQIRLG